MVQIVELGSCPNTKIPMSAFIDCPIMLISDIILLSQMAYYKALNGLNYLIVNFGLSYIMLIFFEDLIPEAMMKANYCISIILYVQSRIPQIWEVYNQKTTGVL